MVGDLRGQVELLQAGGPEEVQLLGAAGLRARVVSLERQNETLARENDELAAQLEASTEGLEMMEARCTAAEQRAARAEQQLLGASPSLGLPCRALRFAVQRISRITDIVACAAAAGAGAAGTPYGAGQAPSTAASTNGRQATLHSLRSDPPPRTHSPAEADLATTSSDDHSSDGSHSFGEGLRVGSPRPERGARPRPWPRPLSPISSVRFPLPMLSSSIRVFCANI